MQALTYILKSGPDIAQAFVGMLRDADIAFEPGRIKTELEHEESQPNLTIHDSNGRAQIVVKNKFRAGLTDAQIEEITGRLVRSETPMWRGCGPPADITSLVAICVHTADSAYGLESISMLGILAVMAGTSPDMTRGDTVQKHSNFSIRIVMRSKLAADDREPVGVVILPDGPEVVAHALAVGGGSLYAETPA